jgi:hypothetical protein
MDYLSPVTKISNRAPSNMLDPVCLLYSGDSINVSFWFAKLIFVTHDVYGIMDNKQYWETG